MQPVRTSPWPCSWEWTCVREETACDARDAVMPKNRKLERIMDRRARLLVWALAESGWTPPVRGERTALGVAVGPGSIGLADWSGALSEEEGAGWKEHPGRLASRIPPLWLLPRLQNMPAALLAIDWGISGPVQTLAGRNKERQLLEWSLDLLEAGGADEVWVMVVESDRGALSGPLGTEGRERVGVDRFGVEMVGKLRMFLGSEAPGWSWWSEGAR